MAVYYHQALGVHHLMLPTIPMCEPSASSIDTENEAHGGGEWPAKGHVPNKGLHQDCPNPGASSFHSAQLRFKNLNDLGQTRITPKGARDTCQWKMEQCASSLLCGEGLWEKLLPDQGHRATVRWSLQDDSQMA